LPARPAVTHLFVGLSSQPVLRHGKKDEESDQKGKESELDVVLPFSLTFFERQSGRFSLKSLPAFEMLCFLTMGKQSAMFLKEFQLSQNFRGTVWIWIYNSAQEEQFHTRCLNLRSHFKKAT
jgi:hypothetical protein